MMADKCNEGRLSDAYLAELGDDRVEYCYTGKLNGYAAYQATTASGKTIWMEYSDDIQVAEGEAGYTIVYSDAVLAYCLHETDASECSSKWLVQDSSGQFVPDLEMTTSDCTCGGSDNFETGNASTSHEEFVQSASTAILFGLTAVVLTIVLVVVVGCIWYLCSAHRSKRYESDLMDMAAIRVVKDEPIVQKVQQHAVVPSAPSSNHAVDLHEVKVCPHCHAKVNGAQSCPQCAKKIETEEKGKISGDVVVVDTALEGKDENVTFQ